MITNLKNIKNELKSDYDLVFYNKLVYAYIFIIAFIAYGVSLFNNIVYVDDLIQDIYYGEGYIKLANTRWGQYLIDRIFSNVDFYPFVNKAIGLLFMLLAAFLLCSIFIRIDGKEKSAKYPIIFSLFLSFPFISDFWNFFEALTIPVCFVITLFCVFYQLINSDLQKQDVVFIGLLMSIVASGYESLLFAYISLVMIILFHEYVINKKDGDWIKEGFRYAIPLMLSVIFRFLIGKLIILVFNIPKVPELGETGLNWIVLGFKPALLQLLFNGWYYGVRALSYLPVLEIDLCVFFFVAYIIILQINGNRKSLILGLLLLLSLILLPIIRGSHFGYRMAQTFHLFVCYAVLLMINLIKNKKNIIKTAFMLLLIFVSYRQSVQMNNINVLSVQRSNNELDLISNIGYKLYTEFDIEKPVIFCGTYQFGHDMHSKLYLEEDSPIYELEYFLRSSIDFTDDMYNLPLYSSSMSSVINWGLESFSDQSVLQRLFSYCGYDIKVLDQLNNKNYLKYTEYARKEMTPLEIREFDDYILVYFG